MASSTSSSSGTRLALELQAAALDPRQVEQVRDQVRRAGRPPARRRRAAGSAPCRRRCRRRAASSAVALIAVSGVRRSCETDCSSTVRSWSVSSSAGRRTRSSREPRAGQRQRHDAGERLEEPLAVRAELAVARDRRRGSRTPRRWSRSGTRPAVPGSRSATRRPPARSRSSRAGRAPTLLGPAPTSPARATSWSAPAIGQQADAPQPERLGTAATRALRSVTPASAFWISSTVSACSSVASAARRSASARASRSARDHHAADDRDDEVDRERGDARGRLDPRRVVRLGEEEVERQPRDDRRAARGDRARRRSPRAAAAA